MLRRVVRIESDRALFASIGGSSRRRAVAGPRWPMPSGSGRLFRALLVSIVLGSSFMAAPVSAQPAPSAGQPEKAPPADHETVPVPDSPQGHIAGEPRLVSVMEITLAVRDRIAAMNAIVGIAKEVGGQPPARNLDRAELRVPVGRVPEVLNKLRGLGAEVAHTAEVKDVSSELADLASSIRSAESAKTWLLGVNRRTGNVNEALLVERRLGALETQLAELRHQQANLEQRVALATIGVTLAHDAPPPPEAVPHPQLPFPWLQRTGLGPLVNPEPSAQQGREVLGSMMEIGFSGELLYLDGLTNHEDPSWAGVLAARSRAVAPGRPIGPAMGLDAGLGGGTGFTYDLDFLLGLGGSPARWMSYGVVSGAGGRSWTGARIPAAWEIPAELFVSLNFDACTFLFQARPQWIGPRIERRQDGSHLGFADEMILRGTITLAGNDRGDDGALSLGVAYHELLDTQLWTFVLGWRYADYRMREVY